jgi:uncharacterized phage protein gp47/JayE
LPFPRPTLTTLRTQVLQAINAAQITDQNGSVLVALLQRAVLRVLANATAGMSYEHYGYLDWIAQQSVPFTATGEFLDAWANLKGVFREKATPTQGTATFTGTVAIPNATALTRSDGAAFVTTDTGVVSGGSVTVTMVASVAGSAGNFDTNTQFSLSNPINGVIGTSTASAQTVVGTDTQTDNSLRTEMLAVYAAPPQGGDRQDYIEFALAVPGVTRAWVKPNGMGAGTVVVWVMLDVAEAAFGGFPQGSNGVAANDGRAAAATGDQLTVANSIFNKQPVTALVSVVAPTAAPQNFSITNLGSSNTAANQALMTTALQEMFVQLGNVGGAVNPVDGSQFPPIQPNDWYAALQAITGLSNFDVPTPSAPITVAAGALPVLGTITFAS